MSNLPIELKEKKLNILQKLRLALFKAQKFTMKKYINAPEYIKSDDSIIYKIIYDAINSTEENLLQIPENKMLELLNKGIININKFSLEKQVDLCSKVPDLVNNHNLSLERQFLIINKFIENGSYASISSFWPSSQQDYLRYLKNNGSLESVLPNILKFLDQGNINQIIRQKSSLLIHLDEKQQIDYMQRPGNEKSFQYMNPEIQLKYMQESPKYIELASEEAQEKFTLRNKENFKKTTSEFQLKTIAKNSKAYKYASEEVKNSVWDDTKNELSIDAAISLLKEDIRNSKFLNLATLSGDQNIYKYFKLFDNIQNESIETIKEYFLHSKMFDAKGKLLPSDKALHGTSPESSCRNR